MNIPVPEIPNVNTYPCWSNSGFHKLKFCNMRRQEVSYLDLPGVETPKYKLLNLCIYFGISPIGISRVGNSGLACTRDLLLDLSGVEIPRHQDLSTLLLFQGFTSRGFVTGEYKGTDPWVSRVPKHRNIQTLDTLCHFGVSQVGFQDWRVQETFLFRYPEC